MAESHLPTRNLGALRVGAVGLGCMGMSEAYGPVDEGQARETLLHALERGVTLFDTADVYGMGHNERFVGDTLRPVRDRVVIATKFGIVRESKEKFVGVNGRPDYVRAACDASLARLGTDRIDLYYQHRVDPDVPIEETVGAMAELVTAGKVLHLGLSEADPQTIRRAHAVWPISAVQSEYSLWQRDPDDEVLPTLRELRIGFVPFSPLSRGVLSGTVRDESGYDDDDFRRSVPRLRGENLTANVAQLDALQRLATARGVTSAQLALAWVLHRGTDIVPIPGTKRRRWLDDNADAAGLTLSAADLEALESAVPRGSVSGSRLPELAAAFNRAGTTGQEIAQNE